MAIGLDPRTGVFVARQPILDRKGAIFGHELLYRHSADTTACTTSGDLAGARTLTDAVQTMGLDILTAGRPAFINLTRQLLVNGAATLLPREVAVFELREDIAVDAEVLAVCRSLHADGYALALDDFRAGTPAEALLPFARFVKVDVLQSPESEWRAMADRLRTRDIRLLAEKVETQEMAAATRAAGYQLFQGYFFCKPTTMSANAPPARRLAYLRLIAALNRENISLGEVEDLVKHDVSLSYRVLRSVNSAGFAVQREITSMRQALVLLGVVQIRRWASVWAMAGLSGGEAPGAVSVALVRARCCELAGEQMRQADGTGYFLLGLCSLLDVILRCPMADALRDMPLPAAIRNALLGESNAARATLDMMVAYERGQWDEAAAAAGLLGLPADVLPAMYGDALRWAREISREPAAA